MIIRRPRVLLGVLACAVLAASFAAPAPAVAAPATAWQVKQGVDPTVLPPGATNPVHYHVLITNVGGQAAPSGVTVTQTISPGATPVARGVEGPLLQFPLRSIQEKSTYPCTISGQQVSCEVKNKEILAGEQFDLLVAVEIEADPPASVTSEVSVSSPGVAPVFNSLSSHTGEEPAPFAFVDGPLGLSGSAFDEAGSTSAAGAHPFDVELSAHVGIVINESGLRVSDPLKTLFLELPAGLVANPLAVRERCTLAEIQEAVAENPITACPPASQVGQIHYSILGPLEGLTSPLIDMVPPPGIPAEFAFVINGTIVHIRGGLAGNFHLTSGSKELTAKFPIDGVKVDLWGVPSDQRHDPQRKGAGIEARCEAEGGCTTEPSRIPFLTMPTSCTEPMRIGATASGWGGSETAETRLFEGLEGGPVEPSGCNQLAFEPTIQSTATTNVGESPSGLEFKIHQLQDESLEGRATAALRDVAVKFPEGLTINASAGNGLSACSMQQMGYAPEEGKVRFSISPQTCPNAARIGAAEVSTSIIDHKLPGSIYLATPFANPFSSLLAIYLAVEDEESGIVAKLAGKVEADPATGRLTATFTENPQLPLEDIDLRFFNGAGGVFTSPLVCGTHTTTSTLTPWSTPEGVDAHPADSFGTTSGCYASEAQAPHTASFTAGSASPLAGAYSPFVLRLVRKDATQHVTGIEAVLPEGLLGRLAGVSYCPESGIARARSREAPEMGKLEQQSPSCPSASEVGTVKVTAGSGITPVPVSGRVYLAGPYKGAPFSLVVITPVLAGPFDLGTVVTRVALGVDETTAQLRAVSDRLPTIRDGIPLDIRSIELLIDRPGFMLNPTSCDVMQVAGAATTAAGATEPLGNRYQVGECGRLGFKPKIAVSLSGAPPRRGGHPQLRAVVTARPGDASIGRAAVILPKTEFLENAHIRTVCTRAQYAAGACPAGSIYGYARAWTPLLEKPLEGPVYLRSSSHRLPDLVAALEGQIKIGLVGKIDSVRGRVRNTFEAVPDAPLSRFELVMQGRGKGLLVNNTGLCRARPRTTAKFVGHNGKLEQVNPLVKVAGCGGGKTKKSGQGRTAVRSGGD